MGAADVYDCPSCGASVSEIDIKCSGCGAPLASTGAMRMVGQVVLDQYEVHEVIGQGGMAVVYAARHRVTGQEVALKILPPEMAAHRGLKSRFVEEARALAKLDHPNIVHLYNFGADRDCFVLAMQLVRGKTWERLIVDGQLSLKRAVEIALDVTRALEYAHGSGVIHRDMKPSNVLIRDTDESAMVMDFGIAKAETSTKLTDTGQTMGTVRYMSPEQIRGKPVDPRADLYSLGISLYEALSGETPFDGETHFDIMNAHLQVVAPPLAERAPDVPESLCRIVHWLIAKHPDDRPASAAEVGRALEAVLAGDEPETPRETIAGPVPAVTTIAPAAPGRRFPLIAVLAIAALVAGAAVVAFVMFRSPPGDGGGEAARSPRPGTGVPTETIAPLIDAAPVAIPGGFEVAVELNYPEDGLRILAAPEVSTAGIRDEYRDGIARWRRYIQQRGLTWPELARPVPPVTVLLGPSELVCDKTMFATREEHAECMIIGSYIPDERTVRIPANSADTRQALHSAIPVAHCDNSGRCMDEAQQYLLALFK